MTLFHLEQLECRQLSDEKRKRVLSFLDEHFHEFLEENYTVILATHGGELVAVVLFRILTQNVLEVPVFFINPNYQTETLFLPLLEHIESYATEHHCQGIVLVYQLEETDFEDLLEKRKWHDPEYYKIRCNFSAFTFKAPWLEYPYILPEGYEIFPWKELTQKERETLKHMDKHEIFPPGVTPFKKEHLLEPLNSLGLRYNGQVVGWMITHRTSPDMIKYVSLWTFPEHRAFGPSVKMLANAISIQIENKIHWAEAEANYLQVDHRWIQFFKKRLAPYSEKVTYLYRAFKTLPQ